MSSVMELRMPRRKSIPQDEPDARKQRQRAFTSDEIRRIAKELAEIAGECIALAENMESADITSVVIDGAEKPARALDLLIGWAKQGETAFRIARRRA